MNIYYVPYEEIDFDKWDKTLMQSFNGNVFGMSWFLNRVTARWDALVADEYNRVMPLPRRKKFFINYIYQPFLTRQLGVYSRKSLSRDATQQFIEAIPHYFRYVDLNLNIFNVVEAPGKRSIPLFSYELDLIPEFTQLKTGFSDESMQHINQATEDGIQVVKNVSLHAFMQFARTHLSMQVRWFNETHFLMLKNLAAFGLNKRITRLTGAYNKYNEPVAMIFWMKTHRKVMDLLVVANVEGIEKKAMHLLVHDYIRENAGKNLILDFGNAQHDEAADFFKGFGAVACPYINYKRNNLPFPLKFL